MSEFRTPYPGYDVLSKWDSLSWNDQTREVVRQRLTGIPPRRFFGEAEWAMVTALCDRLIPQPERAEPVPIARFVDAALFEGRGTGTRFAEMPPDGAAWRQGLAALDAEAALLFGTGFADLAPDRKDAVIAAAIEGDVTAPEWGGLPPRRFMRGLVLLTVVAIYYAHPAAQSEIGFGGPTSPRGYVRLDADRFDPWEAGPGVWNKTTEEGGT